MNFIWMIVQTILTLAVVCGLAYLLFRVLLPRFGLTSSNAESIEVLERLSLEPGKSIFIVRVGEQHLLIGVAEGSVSLLKEIEDYDAVSAKTASSSDSLASGFSEKLGEIAQKAGGKE